MTILVPTLAVAFAALCVWLTVRIVNRKERWAKWALAAVVGLPVLYFLSFGLAIKGFYHKPRQVSYATVVQVYRPILIMVGRSPSGVRWTVEQYVRLWLPSDRNFGIHTDDSANFGIWPT